MGRVSRARVLGRASSRVADMTTAREIRVEAMKRLDEIADHGCEAASARAFEEGRLAALDALELGQPAAPDAEIRQRRLDLDDALRERGTSRPDRDVLASEPIVHATSVE